MMFHWAAAIVAILLATVTSPSFATSDDSQGTVVAHPLPNVDDDPMAPSNSTGHRVSVIVVVVVIMGFSLFGNGFLASRFLRQKRYRTPTNCLIVSQCAADLLLTVVAMPLAIAAAISVQRLPVALELIQIFVTRLFMTVTVMNLSAVAVDRVSALADHDAPSKMSSKKTFVLCVMFWAFSMFISSPMEVVAEGVDHYRRTVNTDFGLLRQDEATNETILTAPALRTIILCCLSMLVIAYCFVKILVLMKSRKSQVQPTAMCDSGMIRTVRMRMRSAYTVIIVFLVFFVSTLPFFTCFILTAANVTVSPCLLIAAKLLTWSSTATKPLVYITRCRKWRGRLLAHIHRKYVIQEFISKTKKQDAIKFFAQPPIDFTGACVLPNNAEIVEAVDY